MGIIRTTGRTTPWGHPIVIDEMGREIIDASFRGPVRLNRSRKWQHASTYQEARDMSPSTEPVR